MNVAPLPTDAEAAPPGDDTAQSDAGQPTRSGAPAPDHTAEGNPWRRALWSALAVWLASVVAHGAVSIYRWAAGGGKPPAIRDLLSTAYKWDTVHYLRIAGEGYGYFEGAPAFFPLYPLTVRAADFVLPQGPMVAGLTVAHLCAFGALFYLHRLAEFEFGPEIAKRATFYLAVFPASFFLFAAYNESMFIMLSVAVLYHARRGHWWLAGALAGLSSATRTFGLLLFIPMAVEYLRQRGWRGIRLDVLALGLVPTGLLAYAAYLWREFGNPLQFSKAQDVWEREYVVPGKALVEAWDVLYEKPFLTSLMVSDFLDLVSLSLAIVLMLLCAVGPWRLRRDQLYLLAYGAVGVLLLSSMTIGWGNPLQSAPRLILETIPIFLVLARMGKNEFVDRMVVMVGISLQGVLLIIFLKGGFVA